MYDPASPFRAVPSPVPAKLKVDFAEQRLRDAILWCELGPGEKVTEQEISERFGLARAAVRTALARLAGEEWIDPLPRKGWRVRPVTTTLIRDLLAARRMIEPIVAAAQPDERDLRRLAELRDIVATLIGRREDNSLKAGRLYDRELMELAASDANTLIAGWLRQVWNHSDRIVHFIERHTAQRLPLIDRTQFVAALAARDREAATRHVLDATDAFEQFVAVSLLSLDAQLYADDRPHVTNNERKTARAARSGRHAERRYSTEGQRGTK